MAAKDPVRRIGGWLPVIVTGLLLSGCAAARPVQVTPLIVTVDLGEGWSYADIAAKRDYRARRDEYLASGWLNQVLQSALGMEPTPPPVISASRPLVIAVVQGSSSQDIPLAQPGTVDGCVVIDAAQRVELVACQDGVRLPLAHLDPPCAAHVKLVLGDGTVFIMAVP